MNENNVYVSNLKVKLFLLGDIKDSDVKRELSFLIDTSLNSTEEFKEFHNDKGVKHYSFGKMIPYEQDYVYKKGKIYDFNLRTVDIKLCDYFKKILVNTVTENIKVLTIIESKVDNRIIEKLYNTTPTVLTFFKDDKEKEVEYWENSKTLVDVLERIQESLIIKYNDFYDEHVPLDTAIFNSISRKNNFPIPQNYKNVRFSTDMFELHVETSDIAQKIAHFACGIGVGGKTSRGFGFVNPKRMDLY